MPRKPILLLLGVITVAWFWNCYSTPLPFPKQPKPQDVYTVEFFHDNEITVSSAAFSPNGVQIMSGYDDGTINLWDLSTGRKLRTFQKGHTGAVTSIVFSSDGMRALSGSNDKTVRLWNIEDGREIGVFKHDDAVTAISFSPDETQILSASNDKTVRLWNVEDGQEIRIFQHDDAVTSIAFSPDGRQILSGSDLMIRLWDTESGHEIRPFPGHVERITSVCFNHDGTQVLSGSQDRTVRLWDASSGKVIRPFVISDKRISSIYTRFTPDGKYVLTAYDDDTYWPDLYCCLLDVSSGKKIDLGKPARGFLNFSPDGKRLLAGKGGFFLYDIPTEDSTRDWRYIAVFRSYKNGGWLISTGSDNYYNSSPNEEQYIQGYKVEYVPEAYYGYPPYWTRGDEKVLDISETHAKFFNPLIVTNRLLGLPDEIIQPVPIQAEPKPVIASDEPGPVVVINSPENRAEFSSAQIVLSVLVIDPKNPVKGVKILLNGELVGSDDMKEISGSKGLSVTAAGLNITGDENRVDFRLPMTLNVGRNRIEVLASNAYSESRTAVEVSFVPEGPQIPPNLWILAIGVNKYDDNKNLGNLNYAVDDAKAIIGVFKAQEGKLYHKVNSRLIADDADIKPTRGEIVDNLPWLKRAAQGDTILLFIAGHGVNDEGGSFWFMPSDAAFNDDGSIRPSRAISYRDIHMIFDMPGQKKLLFIDACHSEGTSGKKARSVDNNQLVNSFKSDTNDTTVILASSRGSERSLESLLYRHGLFTYAIIQGLEGPADYNKNGSITINEFNTYVSSRVPELSNGHQHPTIHIPTSYSDFEVADIKEKTGD